MKDEGPSPSFLLPSSFLFLLPYFLLSYCAAVSVPARSAHRFRSGLPLSFAIRARLLPLRTHGRQRVVRVDGWPCGADPAQPPTRNRVALRSEALGAATRTGNLGSHATGGSCRDGPLAAGAWHIPRSEGAGAGGELGTRRADRAARGRRVHPGSRRSARAGADGRSDLDRPGESVAQPSSGSYGAVFRLHRSGDGGDDSDRGLAAGRRGRHRHRTRGLGARVS